MFIFKAHIALSNKQVGVEIYTNIFKDVLNNKYAITSQNFIDQCYEVTQILKKESQLLELKGPTTVFGDIHGSITGLKHSIKFALKEITKENNVLFLGDYVDRGNHSVEAIYLLITLKSMFPNNVYLLRGNHEEINLNKNNGFKTDCKNKFKSSSDTEFHDINNVFEYLSVSAIVDNTYFCVHGGVSDAIIDRDQIRNLSKPFSIIHFKNSKKFNKLSKSDQNAQLLVSDLLWSDPSNFNSNSTDLSSNFQPNVNRNNNRKVFNEKEAQIILNRLGNLKCIIRAHEMVEINNHKPLENCITIFSASNYIDYFSNAGFLVQITPKKIAL